MADCKATVILGSTPICGKCIKADVCEIAKEFEKHPITGMFIESCEYFKDRSKFVELPSVSVPIKIYLSDDVDNTFVLRNYCFDCNQNSFYMIIQCIETQEFLKRSLDKYGETVFLTKEEAKKALEEREQD